MSERRVIYSTCLVAVALAFAGWSGAAAEGKNQAQGLFESKDWRVDLVGAYAYPDKVGLDDSEGIKVAVSNVEFNTERLNALWNRTHVLQARLANDEVLIAFFHFDRQGQYQGYSYSFGSGDACGHCYDSKTVSTVKVRDGRIAGKLSFPSREGENVSFDFEFDVPIAPTDFGKPLPADFGEFAQIYAGFHQAVVHGPPSALAPFLTSAEVSQLESAGDSLLGLYRENHPPRYKIVRGFQRDDRALLLIEGETDFADLRTEVHFVREGGKWRIFDEIAEFVFD